MPNSTICQVNLPEGYDINSASVESLLWVTITVLILTVTYIVGLVTYKVHSLYMEYRRHRRDGGLPMVAFHRQNRVLPRVAFHRQNVTLRQIVPFKGRISIKQYNPKKPHKWGYKIFVLSGISGFSYDFEVYTGASDNKMEHEEPDLGISSNVVVRMARSIPRHQHYQLYFDNWFNGIHLQVYLAKEGILSLGTVRRNRLAGCTLPSEKDLKSQGRGSFSEKTCTVDGIQLSAVAWFDNKIVHLLSSFVGAQPESEVKRYFVSEKKHKMVTCPRIVKVYNVHMGGVDLLDSILGYYRIKIRSKKWYHRIFFHLIDMITVNAWLLWRRNTGKEMQLKYFKAQVADCLCKEGNCIIRKRGRSSMNVEAELKNKTKKHAAAALPIEEVRHDRHDHMPLWMETRQRCKFPKCSGFTFIYCAKCQVALCFNKNKDCFNRFHVE